MTNFTSRYLIPLLLDNATNITNKSESDDISNNTSSSFNKLALVIPLFTIIMISSAIGFVSIELDFNFSRKYF